MSAPTQGNPPPGWYPQGDHQRYWDGSRWTEHTSSLAGPAAGPAPQQPALPGPNAYASHATTSRTAKKPIYTRWWFIAGGVFLALVVVGAALSGGDGGGTVTTADSGGSSSSTSAEAAAGGQSSDAAPAAGQSSKASSAAKPKPKGPGIGTPVRDGKFEFTVTKVVKGKTKVGDQYLGKKAQGQFIFVYVTVKNIGDEAQILFGDNQTLYDAKGRKFSADTEAGIYVGDAKSFIEEINPGNKMSGIIVFDVPKDAAPTKIELHDSAFSGGVEVALS